MSIKKEYILLAAIILTLTFYLVLRNQNGAFYRLPELSNVTVSEITRIEIAKFGSSLVISKKDNKWIIGPEEYPVDINKVNEMLEIIGDFTLTALVSESKDYNRYSLDDDKKIIVKAWNKDKLKREFEVGKDASSFRHTFVRLNGDDRVYHAREAFREKFDETMEKLRDKSVLSFEKKEIQEIHDVKGKQSIILTRKQILSEENAGQVTGDKVPETPKTKTVWQSSDGRECDEYEVGSLLTMLSGLSCEKYIYDRKKEDLIDPISSILLKGTKDFTLNIYAKSTKETSRYPATSSENAYPFLLPDWQANNIMIDPKKLLKKQDES